MEFEEVCFDKSLGGYIIQHKRYICQGKRQNNYRENFRQYTFLMRSADFCGEIKYKEKEYVRNGNFDYISQNKLYFLHLWEQKRVRAKE